MSELVVLLEDIVVGVDDELEVVDGAAAPLAAGVAVEPHAANPIGRAAARATKAVARLAPLVRAFIVGSYFHCW
ncbi:MAG TPA: hypothetical protein VFT68_07905 [Lapillicoccus sp.]|nr:hypothetical protein [Lapillicoccus sp.]